MTENEYVLTTNKTLLLSIMALMRDLIADDDGTYGLTTGQRQAITKATTEATDSVFRKIPDLE